MKKHILLLFAMVFFLILQIQSINNSPFQTKLIGKIQVNDTIVYTLSELEKESIQIDGKNVPRLISIWIDSSAIKKHQLISYRFLLEKNRSIYGNWTSYPYKEFKQIKGRSDKLIVEAKNQKGDVFTDELLIQVQFGIFSSGLAWVIYILLFGCGTYLVYALASYRLAREKYLLETVISNRTKELSEQKTKYEELLTNYLPKEDFEKLKEQTKEKTERFKMVTVLFSNILGFTNAHEHPESTAWNRCPSRCLKTYHTQ